MSLWGASICNGYTEFPLGTTNPIGNTNTALDTPDGATILRTRLVFVSSSKNPEHSK